MTKRHFEDFARRIRLDRDAVLASDTDAVRVFDETVYAAVLISTVAAIYNPRFDRKRFMRACGILD